MQALVVIRLEINCFLVQIFQHCGCRRGHARFGVTHGGWRIALDGSKVSLLVNQQVARLPHLPQIHKRWINHALAVRVIVAAGVAANLGALDVLASWREI